MYICIMCMYIYKSVCIFAESLHALTGVVEHHACEGVYVRQMLRTSAYTFASRSVQDVHMRHIYTCTYYMYICIYVCIYICMYVCIYMYTHVYAYMYGCIYMCMCVYVYVYIYMCICMYIYIYTYLYIACM